MAAERPELTLGPSAGGEAWLLGSPAALVPRLLALSRPIRRRIAIGGKLCHNRALPPPG